jgi:hypothetical protein
MTTSQRLRGESSSAAARLENLENSSNVLHTSTDGGLTQSAIASNWFEKDEYDD